MALRSNVIEVRKNGAQEIVNQTGGPWTDITFQIEDRKSYTSGISHSSGVLTVSVTGTYLVKYFIAIDGLDGNWPTDVIMMNRVIINGTTVPAQSYANAGHYDWYGRHGLGHSFMVTLTAGDTIKVQYRVHANQAAYSGTPLPDIGGESGDATGSPGGPAASTFGLELVGETDDVAFMAMHLTSNLANFAAINTWYDIYEWASQGVEDASAFFGPVDGSTGEFTIPESGYYLVGYSLQPDMVSTTSLGGDRIYGRVLKNGVDIERSHTTLEIHTTLGWNCSSTTFLEYFDVGDKVKLQYYTTDAGTQWVIGGSDGSTAYREYVTSIFFMKVSDYATSSLLTTEPGDVLEAATVGDTNVPSGWTENHSDVSAAPFVRWHVSNTRSFSPATKTIRYANGSTGNYNTAGSANNGDITTGVFAVPNFGSAYTNPTLELDYYRVTEGGEHYDRCRVEVWATGLGLLTSIQTTYPNAAQSVFVTQNAWAHLSWPISSSILGRSDVYLKFFFNTGDSAGNTFEGQYICNIQIWGTKI